MTAMRAAVYHGAGDVRVETRPVPVPGPGEVLVRVGVCGVCGSDASEFDRGPLLTVPPVILGHEFAGTVEAVGEGVTGLVPGAEVVCGAGVSCGVCKPCRQGRTNLCRDYHTLGLQRDGGLAEYAVVPAGILLDVSGSGLTMDTLGLAQPMSIGVHAVRRSGLSAEHDAVIVGGGGIGAFITVAAVATGARVLVVDLNPSRLEIAQRLGAHATARADEGSLAEALAEHGMDADVFFEVSGSGAGLASVLGAARPGSTIVPVGIQRQPAPEALGSWTLAEYLVVGTVAHVFATDVPRAVELLAGRPDWSDLADHVVPLEDVVDSGLRPLLDGTASQIKTLVDPHGRGVRPAVHGRR